MNSPARLRQIYDRLLTAFGPQHWWPGDTPFEVMVGAILTQNTNWGNVEKALANMKAARVLSPRALRDIPIPTLAELIRPSGYYNMKAVRLKNYMDFLFGVYRGSIPRMARTETAALREQILAIKGIGPETADSILLYALDKPVFVVDAYTVRFLYRHGLIGPEADYHQVQELFMSSLPLDRPLFNEYHALIVRLGKDFCRPTPRCETCPLRAIRYSLRRRCPRCFRSWPTSVDHCVICDAV